MKMFLPVILSFLFSTAAAATDFGLLGYDPWPFALNPIPWTEMDGVWVDEGQPDTSIFCVQTIKTERKNLKQGQVGLREIDRKTGALILIGVGTQTQNQLFGTLLSATGKHPFALVAPKTETMPRFRVKAIHALQGYDRLGLRVYISVNRDYIYADTILRRLTSAEGQIFTKYCDEK
jgi:hypothetical protein